ncbi:MAG: TIM barrel protein [Spirochaetaceae bacterium]|nr:TIM barrel protein [Myxococcales bacterium]MCB9726753.1 TIM barrel protein [Spirochaetaceae bacterium]HPG24047.1 TIM barrel protein [Myxococcota bacterium]
MFELCFNTMNRSAWFRPEGDPDLPGQIRAAASAGFGSVGPDHFSIVRHVERGGTVEDLARTIEAAGLRTFELPTWIVGDDPAAARADADALLRVAAQLRPSFVQTNVTGRVTDEVLDVLRREGEAFLELGSRLAIEWLPWLPEVRSLASTRALLRRLDLEGAGICLDVWHFTHSGDGWGELEALPLAEIAYVQFDDHPPLASEDLVEETVSRRAMPGEGCFELERFVDRVRAKGYTAPVSCEILSESMRDMDLDEFAARVHSSCRRYWP